jgi:hypothetical protein
MEKKSSPPTYRIDCLDSCAKANAVIPQDLLVGRPAAHQRPGLAQGVALMPTCSCQFCLRGQIDHRQGLIVALSEKSSKCIRSSSAHSECRVNGAGAIAAAGLRT